MALYATFSACRRCSADIVGMALSAAAAGDLGTNRYLLPASTPFCLLSARPVQNRPRGTTAMRVITQSTFGGPEVLTVAERPNPTPLATEVLVQVRATGLNPVDAAVRSGAFPLLGDPPFGLGWDISGEVVEVPPGVSRFEVGDVVYALPSFPREAGVYAEYVAAPSRQ